MDSEKWFTVESLNDDLVVKILSRVPFKSFCRFKCVCKAWLAFSSDPYHSCRKRGTVGRPSYRIRRPGIGFGNGVRFGRIR